MTSFLVRPAALADAPAISAIHCSNVTAWKTWDADGTSRPARYADLTPYQRWLNGGPWLDPSTCVNYLRRMIHSGVVLVAEVEGRALATAELHFADEPIYGPHFNLNTLYVHRNHQRQGLGTALIQQAIALAREQGCHAFTVANVEAPDFYRKHGLVPAERWVRLELPVAPSHSFIPIRPLLDSVYDPLRGYNLLIGRYQNAHHEWERTRPNATPNFAQWRNLRLERYSTQAGRHDTVIILEESPHQRGTAECFLYAITDRLTRQMLSAMHDVASRFGFSRLHCFVRSDVKLPGATATDYKQQLFVKHLK